MTGLWVRMRARGWLAQGWRALTLVALLAGTMAVAALPDGPATPPPGTPERPMRIVSLNLCTDQLLMQMVAPDRIAAVTHLARDPRVSAMAREAGAIPAILGTAEEVIAYDPDLVLAGTFSTRQTVAILRRLDYRVVEFAPAQDFAAIRESIATLSRVLGEPARGAAMIARIDAELARERPDDRQRRPAREEARAVFSDYDANGYISGSGTLMAAVAEAAGVDLLGERLGIAGMRPITLEHLLLADPDMIDAGDEFATPALATQTLRHPALRRFLQGRQSVSLPARYTACGTMKTLEAVRLLRAQGRMTAR